MAVRNRRRLLKVYLDSSRPTSWISREFGQDIAGHLSGHGFEVLSASELTEWVQDVIAEGSAEESVLLFAQDVMPHELVQDISPNDLIRGYLDSGGRAVWLGDVPCWLRSDPNRADPEAREEIWRVTAPLLILGILPIVAVPSEPARAVGTGAGYFTHRWYGIRPALPAPEPAGFFMRLADSNTTLARFMYLRPSSARERLLGWAKSLVQSVKIGPVSLGVGQDPPSPGLVVQGQRLPNAWSIRFARYSPSSGFVRMWDFTPRTLTDSMVSDLLKIAAGTSAGTG